MIPTTFNLLGQTITVSFNPTLLVDNDSLGEAVYRTNTIYLAPPGDTWPIPSDRLEQTFYHELVHFILHNMKHKLSGDEGFVDLFASLLHQAISSYQGELKND